MEMKPILVKIVKNILIGKRNQRLKPTTFKIANFICLRIPNI